MDSNLSISSVRIGQILWVSQHPYWPAIVYACNSGVIENSENDQQPSVGVKCFANGKIYTVGLDNVFEFEGYECYEAKKRSMKLKLSENEFNEAFSITNDETWRRAVVEATFAMKKDVDSRLAAIRIIDEINSELSKIISNMNIEDANTSPLPRSEQSQISISSIHVGQMLWVLCSTYPYWPSIVCALDSGVNQNNENIQRPSVHVKCFANGKFHSVALDNVFEFEGYQSYEEKKRSMKSKLSENEFKEAFSATNDETWLRAVAEATTIMKKDVDYRFKAVKITDEIISELRKITSSINFEEANTPPLSITKLSKRHSLPGTKVIDYFPRSEEPKVIKPTKPSRPRPSKARKSLPAGKMKGKEKAFTEASNSFDKIDNNNNEQVIDLEINETQPTQKKPQYTKITTIVVVPPAKQTESVYEAVTCNCEPDVACGPGEPECANRQHEMDCDPKLCPNGSNCKNQNFQRKENAAVKVMFISDEKGFGLFADEFINAGAFVIEYVGELITKEEFEKRKINKENQAGPQHLYFMTYEKGLYIDAERKGNESRFVNHSCAPNSQMQKRIVNKVLRIGYFALKNIEKGTEITTNYSFDRGSGHPCLCGEKDCKGIIGKKTK